MNLYLIRHTKVDINPDICYGQSDVELADSFLEEAEIIQKQLHGKQYDKVFSSPLSRCRKLSEYLFKSEIKYDNRLMELNFGDWELKKWDNLSGTQFNNWCTDFVNTSCPNGESFIDLHNRVNDLLIDLKNQSHRNVAIIAHGGVIRSLLVHIQNKELKDAFKREIKYGEILNCTL